MLKFFLSTTNLSDVTNVITIRLKFNFFVFYFRLFMHLISLMPIEWYVDQIFVVCYDYSNAEYQGYILKQYYIFVDDNNE